MKTANITANLYFGVILTTTQRDESKNKSDKKSDQR